MNRPARGWLAGMCLAMCCGRGLAAEAATGLPEPLTLDYALSRVDIPHPALQQPAAELDVARARERQLAAERGWHSYLEGRLRYIDPPDFVLDQSHDDHRLGLFVDKTLYDSGRTAAGLAAARQTTRGRELRYRQARQQRRLQIMQDFFAVVLADMDFYRYNEEMAVEFVSLDKLRDRRELGQVSDLEVLEQDSRYQAVRQKFITSQHRQRQTRARLAYVLGQAGQLPSTVARPATLPHLDRKLPELEMLQAEAVQNNRDLEVLRTRLAAARSELQLARAGDNPTLIGSGEVATYSRERAGDDNWRLALTLQVPLTDGGRSDAEASAAQARIYQLQAQLAEQEERLRQQVLELWLALEGFQAEREQARRQLEYRELYLDRSRALYELEVRTDLGDAMVRYTEAERALLAAEFNIALGWERLDILLGAEATGPVKKPIDGRNDTRQPGVTNDTPLAAGGES